MALRPSTSSEPQGERRRREGRGKLSTIEMLPEEADEAIAWANQALRDREMPQTEILRQFNAMLADHGIKGVSKGAFSRYSIRVAIEARKLEASRQMTDAILSRLAPGERSDSTIAATELLKFRILEMVTNEEEPDPKLLNIASLALSRMSMTALRETHGQRLDKADQREESKLEEDRIRAEREQREKADTAATVEQIASEAGLSAERVAAIRKGVLGLSG